MARAVRPTAAGHTALHRRVGRRPPPLARTAWQGATNRRDRWGDLAAGRRFRVAQALVPVARGGDDLGPLPHPARPAPGCGPGTPAGFARRPSATDHQGPLRPRRVRARGEGASLAVRWGGPPGGGSGVPHAPQVLLRHRERRRNPSGPAQLGVDGPPGLRHARGRPRRVGRGVREAPAVLKGVAACFERLLSRAARLPNSPPPGAGRRPPEADSWSDVRTTMGSGMRMAGASRRTRSAASWWRTSWPASAWRG